MPLHELAVTVSIEMNVGLTLYGFQSLNPWVEGSSPSGGSFPKALQDATLRHNGFTRRDLRQQSGRSR